MIKRISSLFLLSIISLGGFAQDKGLVNTNKSPFAVLHAVDMEDVSWTSGFWAERFNTCQNGTIPGLWKTYMDPDVAHAFRNFEIAAGLQKGDHSGPSFHDGDFYKLLESLASAYAVTKDENLNKLLDEVIPVIAKSQREDGYIHSPVVIEQRKGEDAKNAFHDRLHFETYNMGHLMTAACIHYRATGKTSLLEVARRATDFLYDFYKRSSPELARNAICPSHYMGVIEMYRTTNDLRYLELAKNLIEIRGMVENGTDDNQDRVPFRAQSKAMGHAVRANYLYAGVADVYAETGDTTLLNNLYKIWDDVVYRKMYITGGCGALYDGVSPDGTSYDPKDVQKIHQAYGRDFQLPNHTAHNESCANIGNVLWNWRMLQITGDAKYADVMETALYNSVLSSVSLDGKRFLYTNPLSYSNALPFQQRWSKQRVEYISLSNCCPPNIARTLAETNSYAYGISDKGLYCNLYGSNMLATQLKNGSTIKIKQETNYPWEGHVVLNMQETPHEPFSLFLRIPAWCTQASIKVNGKKISVKATSGSYAEITRAWSAGDKIELMMAMEAKLVEANHLVEEARGQVAVTWGPVVYCLESADLPTDVHIYNIGIPSGIKLKPTLKKIDNNQIMVLEGKANLIDNRSWNKQLYREIADKKPTSVPLKLVPYFAWGNRGASEMSVWMPVCR